MLWGIKRTLDLISSVKTCFMETIKHYNTTMTLQVFQYVQSTIELSYVHHNGNIMLEFYYFASNSNASKRHQVVAWTKMLWLLFQLYLFHQHKRFIDESRDGFVKGLFERKGTQTVNSDYVSMHCKHTTFIKNKNQVNILKVRLCVYRVVSFKKMLQLKK